MKTFTIAIIGHGIVGQATERVINKDHKVIIHDTAQDKIVDYPKAAVIFICTPTEFVEQYIKELRLHPFVYVRSTIPFKMVVGTNIAVWPEFLTERTAVRDSFNPKLNVIGLPKGEATSIGLPSEILYGAPCSSPWNIGPSVDPDVYCKP